MNRKSHVHARLAAIVGAVLTLAGTRKPVQTPLTRPYGCSVKYWH
jgi:hypothetical protein